jgi:hypothetical protein
MAAVKKLKHGAAGVYVLSSRLNAIRARPGARRARLAEIREESLFFVNECRRLVENRYNRNSMNIVVMYTTLLACQERTEECFDSQCSRC